MNRADRPLAHLGGLSASEFLHTHWQKRPLYVANALPELFALDPDRLAGFALEAEIESRLVLENPAVNDPLKSTWEVRHGPLAEADFATLGDSHWSLLVQAVDQLVPEIHQLLDRFRFIPNWRLDDVMVSYAVDQGSVGPHFDYYDVFLLQAKGRRQWRLGPLCTAETPVREGMPLKLLEQFATEQTFETLPGDLLYLPPQMAHWGIASGDSMTYSIGFRGASRAELVAQFSDRLSDTDSADQRYADPDLRYRANPGEITFEDVQRVRRILTEALTDEGCIAEWFASYMTEPGRSPLSFEPAAGNQLLPQIRCAYIDNRDGSAKLFVNGEAFTTSLELAATLCRERQLQPSQLNDRERLLLKQWREQGWLT